MPGSVRSIVQSRNDWLVIAAAAMVLTYTFGDFLSTILAMSAGGFEKNPLPRFILNNLGVGWFFLAKLVEGVFLVGVCAFLDADPIATEVFGERPRLRSALSNLSVAIAAAYAVFGLSLVVNNTLVYISLTGA